MNERIRELTEQAGLKYYNWSTNESNIVDGDFKYPRAEDYEKFAELIVGECADYIRSNYDSWDAEPLAFNMEKDFGLHGDYAE